MSESDFSTFEEYCQERWGWSRHRSNQLIEAAEVVTDLGNHGHQTTMPANERQARELARVPEEKRA